jgi:CubicO group peptidase (beta-lactamase class C family)
MAIFGQMILDKGKYKDKQIAPQNWIDISTKETISLSEEEESSYGYLWWIDHIKDHKVITAWGHGDQMIHIIPDENMVVVFTTDCSGDEGFSFGVLEEMIE